MKKFSKIFGIFTTGIIAVQNIFQILPKESKMMLFLKKHLTPIVTSNAFNVIILIVCVIVLITMIYNMLEEKKEHCFRMGSARFCKFFSKWYSQEGTLSIFCDDLDDWIEPHGNQDIYNALKQKSQDEKLQLFLGHESPQRVVDELRSLGADVHQAPADIITNYSFSCLSIMGNNSAVIIRNKQDDASQRIKFIEISNNYVTGLLNALINERI